jgi:hypothetical protein
MKARHLAILPTAAASTSRKAFCQIILGFSIGVRHGLEPVIYPSVPWRARATAPLSTETFHHRGLPRATQQSLLSIYLYVSRALYPAAGSLVDRARCLVREKRSTMPSRDLLSPEHFVSAMFGVAPVSPWPLTNGFLFFGAGISFLGTDSAPQLWHIERFAVPIYCICSIIVLQ